MAQRLAHQLASLCIPDPRGPIHRRGNDAAANHRKVTEIAFKPDFKPDGRAAPFKRNDAVFELMPKGVIVFPGPASPATSPTRRKAWATWRSLVERSRQRTGYLIATIAGWQKEIIPELSRQRKIGGMISQRL
jgi:hypothetical protein